MSLDFNLIWNTLCGYLPTELASLPIEFSPQHKTNDGSSIGSPCLPSSNASSIVDDDHDGPTIVDDDHDGPTRPATWLLWLRTAGGVAVAIMVLGLLAGFTARAKCFAANGDNSEGIISYYFMSSSSSSSSSSSTTTTNTMSSPLLDNSNIDHELNGSMTIEPNDGELGLQLKPMPDQPLNLTHAWRNSDLQLVVLDSELQVMLWSEGMAKAMLSFRPALGTSIEGLPFSSVGKQQTVISAL